MTTGPAPVRFAAFLAVLAGLTASAKADTPIVSLGDYRADPASVTVSGISSGGYMAHQFHVAYSNLIAGAGIVAGGPYRCAAHGPSSQHECNAITLCTRFSDPVPPWFCPSLPRRRLWSGIIEFTGPPDVDPLIRDTRELAEMGAIAGPENLCGDRVLLLYGEDDEAVPESILRSLDSYLDGVLDCTGDRTPAAVELREMSNAAHTMPIDDLPDVDWPCSVSEPPYLGECGYSAAAQILDFLYDAQTPGDGGEPVGTGGLVRFATADTVRDPGSAGLAEYGYLYVPADCVGTASCRLHVVFHGCRQSARSSEMGETFVRHAGYNGWADANRTIILYPQVYHPDGLLDRWSTLNPRGCWDFWGYASSTYSTRSGLQMDAVRQIVDVLIGNGS